MAIDLFSFVASFDRQLATLQHLLDKGAAHDGAGEAILDWRLVDDMRPFRFQLRNVLKFTQAWPAKVAGVAEPAEVGEDLDLAGFGVAIAAARAWLATLTPAQFAGRDDVPLTVELFPGMVPTLPAGRWLTNYAATNAYFHLSMAYAILRARGVPVGKADLFAAGL